MPQGINASSHQMKPSYDGFSQTNIDNFFLSYDQQSQNQQLQQQSQQYGQSILRPNMQNNYYYNFNNNYGPTSNNNIQIGQTAQLKPAQRSNIPTKSIEVQVTPEKLEEETLNEGESKLKKRRRRQRKQKSKESDKYPIVRNPNEENWQYEYQKYAQQYASVYMPNQYMMPQARFQQPPYYYQQQNYMIGTQNPFMYMQQHHQNLAGFMPDQAAPSQPPQQSFDDLKFKEHMRDYFRTMFYPFQNEQLKELVLQIDIYIQLLYQMLLLEGKSKSTIDNNSIQDKNGISNDKIKYKIYSLLYDFQKKKEQTLKPFKLPEYKIPLIVNSDQEALVMNPQDSFIDESSQTVDYKIIEGQQPPSNTTFNSSHNNRRKFSYVDDNFLLLGLRQYGYKEVELIRNNWLPNKSSNEIKHRYKNLTCAKAPDNIIKRWKLTHNIPLNDNEEKQLAKAIKWFGSNTNREYQNIVSDHSRAERFGQLMLEDDEGQKDFEEINLDKVLEDEKNSDENDESLYDDEEDSQEQLNNLQDLLANYVQDGEKNQEEGTIISIDQSEVNPKSLKQDMSALNDEINDDNEADELYEEVEL
ncbi:UNKNOWN [Stylonychia lemnae]|uniref:Myb-like domain-containing protein n=1 Tax=Stylonychia lemnae TaxID=5949 RepID=A0A078A1R5_STYLE|nr:UNKNOWN [Stylonychia lemnae]|eukprot:CDW76055.1 UNKNOWN [Stylonychia lemnae]